MNEIQTQEIKTPANITADDVRKYICPLASDKEIFMFLQMCRMTNLNPFLREAYLVKYKADQPATMLTGYESYIKRAERSELYGGLKAWTEGSVATGDLKGIVEVYRKDWPKPLVHEAYYDEYVQMMYDPELKKKRPNRFWSEKPRTMIKKVAISQAFRLAFPAEFSGMPHTFDERNDVEYQPEAIKSTKPQIEMPKPTVVSSEIVDSRPIHGVSTPIVEAESEPAIQETKPFPIISQSEWQRLVNVAIKNGWSEDDVVTWVRDLGYRASRKHVLLNAQDAEDFEYFFSKSKAEHEAMKAEASK